jgi:hypothetical protein
MVSLSLFTLIIATAAALVHSARAPLYIFTEDAIGIGCTEAEWNTVLQVMANATTPSARRRLGHGQRRLACPYWCGKYCAAMGIGCGSYGRRRQLQSGGGANCTGVGGTCINGDVSSCAANITAIDKALANFTATSTECQMLLAGSKTVSCPDFTTADCYIKGISAWDTSLSNMAPALLIPKMSATGTTFCKKSEVALLVNTNFIVGKVTMSMYFSKTATGPLKLEKAPYEVMSAPYYVFGSKPLKLNTTMGVQVMGRVFAEGFYALTVVAAESPHDPKTVSFSVISC